MSLGNLLVLTQVIACLMSFIFSFFIFIPIAVNLGEFNGSCLLYTSGTWNGRFLTSINWGPSSACNFPVFIGVLVMLISCFQVVWQSVYLCRGTDSSWLATFLTCLSSIVLSVLLFASALTVSVGFQKWCDFITGPQSPVMSCEDLQYNDIFRYEKHIDTSQFYTEMEMAQFGSWTSWICWVLMSVISVVRMYSYHRQEAFLTSMDRERQRLLQHFHPSTQYEQI